MIRRRAGALVCAALLQLLLAGTAAGGFSGALTVGYDSFRERYFITDRDTLDELSEFRTRLKVGYLRGVFLSNYLQVEGESIIGEESVESVAHLDLQRRFGASRFAMSSNLSYRTYRDGTQYSFPNDFLRYDLRTYFQRKVRSDLALRLTEKLEVLDYQDHTEFDYDYVRNTVEFSGDMERGFSSAYHAFMGIVTRSVPDSSEISYNAYTGGGDYRLSLGFHKQVFVTLRGERRVYEDEPTKSPFWALFSDATIEPFLWGRFGVTFNNSFEKYAYDTNSDAFFDYIENHSSLLLSYYPQNALTVRVGPAFSFFSSDFSRDDEYVETGGRLVASYNSGGRLWLSVDYEAGYRNYAVDGADASSAIFSDFTYHRLIGFGTARVIDNVSVNLFVNYEPENHALKDDDTTATLFSADVSYRF